jgi:hypothetical protein
MLPRGTKEPRQDSLGRAAGVVELSWWLGVYALLFGIALVSAAFRIRYHPI